MKVKKYCHLNLGNQEEHEVGKGSSMISLTHSTEVNYLQVDVPKPLA
jgi:hypothetical protein